MTRALDSSSRIYFTSQARDLTPNALEGTARILYAPYSEDTETTLQCSLLLSAHERQRASRFARPADEALFIQRRAFRRYCGAVALGSSQPLSAFEFVETEIGRPWLTEEPEFWFSFASCRFGFIGAWSSTHPIGIDIEDVTRDLDFVELARQFFSPTEAEMVKRTDVRQGKKIFFGIWCLKEAALKCIGQGIPFGLDAFQFELEPVPQIVKTPLGHGGPEKYRAFVSEESERCIAVVSCTPL